MYIRHEIECIHIHLYIYSDISIYIYIYTFMYIRACVWIHHKALDYGYTLQNTPGFHVWNVTNQANCDGLREELDAVRFRRLLEDPRGWVRCRRLGRHHFNTQNYCNSCFFAIL